MMTVREFLILCAAVVALGYIVVRIWADAHPLPLTVEQEQERDRDVVGSIPQTYPATRDADDYEDPLYHVVHFMHENNQASL